ncbi:MAG: hypothetical protein JKY01_07285 [Pseudomonadales bacterium]|nr:hypothetical protein [Pseudomonadales bacterium]
MDLDDALLDDTGAEDDLNKDSLSSGADKGVAAGELDSAESLDKDILGDDDEITDLDEDFDLDIDIDDLLDDNKN